MLLERLIIEDVIRLRRKEESPLPAGTNHTCHSHGNEHSALLTVPPVLPVAAYKVFHADRVQGGGCLGVCLSALREEEDPIFLCSSS